MARWKTLVLALIGLCVTLVIASYCGGALDQAPVAADRQEPALDRRQPPPPTGPEPAPSAEEQSLRHEGSRSAAIPRDERSLSNEPPPVPPRLVVRVTQGGAPRSGATVTLTSVGRVEVAETSEDGEALFQMPDPEETSITVRAEGAALFRARVDEVIVHEAETPPHVRVALRPACRIEVTVVGDDSSALPFHMVDLFLLNPSGEPKGTAVSRYLSTDAAGIARCDDLATGEWEVGTPEWRGHEASDKTTCSTTAATITFARLVARRRPLSGRIEFTVHLPDHALFDEHGVCEN